MKKNNLVNCILALGLLSSCNLPNINLSSNETTSSDISHEFIESSIIEENPIIYDLTLVEHLNIGQDDVLVNSVLSGPLKEAGCYEVIKFVAGSNMETGYIYSCKVKGAYVAGGNDILFQVGIFENKFLGMNIQEQCETPGFGEKTFNYLTSNLPGLDATNTIEKPSVVAGATSTWYAISECIEVCRENYLKQGKDGSTYGDPEINYLPSDSTSEETLPSEPSHILEEYGMIIKDNDNIFDISEVEGVNAPSAQKITLTHLIYNKDNINFNEDKNDLTYVYNVKTIGAVNFGQAIIKFDVSVFVAIDNKTDTIYGIGIDNITTTNYAIDLVTYANETFIGKASDEINKLDNCIGATYSSNFLKDAIELAFEYHNNFN